MIIYRKKHNSLKKFWVKFKNKKGILFKLFSLALALGLLLLIGIFLQKRNYPSWAKKQLSVLLYFPYSFYCRLTTKPTVFYIDIAFDNFQKLQKKREEALKLGVLINNDVDFVAAKIRYDGQQIPVKIRLKGDWLDQVKTDKWAFRIEVDNNYSILGMSKFSLHIPEARNNLNEWLFLKTIQKEGVIGLRYDFVDVYVNGDHKGIYAFEEHFSKELLENNKRREAPILKYNEDVLWEKQAKFGFNSNRPWDFYYRILIEPFQWGKIEKREDLYEQFLKAEDLLRGYRDKKYPPEMVFDYDLWATFFALADVFGTTHSFSWQNLRFYYNPISAKLEPIPFDNMPGAYPKNILLNEVLMITFPYQPLFEDEKFTNLYLEKLNNFLRPEYVKQILTESEKEIKRYTKILSIEKKYSFDPTFISSNQIYMKNKIRPIVPFIAFIKENADAQLQLELYNADRVPVKILGIRKDGVNIFFEKPVTLKTKFENTPITPEIIDLSITAPVKPESIEVIYQFFGEAEQLKQTVKPWPHNKIELMVYQLPERITSGIVFDSKNNQYVINGKVVVDTILNFNKGSRVVIMPGSHLIFKNGGGIVSLVPMFSLGEEGNPVLIESLEKETQGILVVNAGNESKITFTEIRNLANFKQNSWETTGVMTFYKSAVAMENVTFEETKSGDDALNIVNSKFNLKNLGFYKTFSDGLDVDFGEGEIESLTCTNTGNDCLDFSGSNVLVKNLRVDSAGDKGVSVGEKSNVDLRKVIIKNTKFAFASKDLSFLKIDDALVEGGLYAVAAYQKKPEFGPATAEVGLLQAPGMKELFLIEKGSAIWYYSTRLDGKAENVLKTMEDSN